MNFEVFENYNFNVTKPSLHHKKLQIKVKLSALKFI